MIERRNDEHDRKVTKNDDAIEDYERSIGLKRLSPVTPAQRRAFKAGLAAGIERCAQWCEKNKGTACAEHCAPVVRALLK